MSRSKTTASATAAAAAMTTPAQLERLGEHLRKLRPVSYTHLTLPTNREV